MRIEERSNSSWRVAILVALAGFIVWQFTQTRADGNRDPEAEPRAVTVRGELPADEMATIELAERASPSVVFIRSVAVVPRPLNSQQIQEGTGSGMVWDREGHIVTNYHVVHSSRELEVTLADHRTYRAAVIGHEIEKDIAVLALETRGEALVPITIGSSSDLRVGQKVFAIGNPFGLDQTLTSGLISGLGREMQARFEEEERGRHPITDLIQTDAAINPGNSGGPLLDSAGRLIGMNTAIVTETGAASGIGFAIPVDTINRIVTEILRYGQARRPGLGIKIASDTYARAFRIEGVVIAEVVPGSAAERAGIQAAPLANHRPPVANDVIVAVNGIPVRTSNDLFRELDHHSVGDRVRLGVLRGGKSIEIEALLQDMH